MRTLIKERQPPQAISLSEMFLILVVVPHFDNHIHPHSSPRNKAPVHGWHCQTSSFHGSDNFPPEQRCDNSTLARHESGFESSGAKPRQRFQALDPPLQNSSQLEAALNREWLQMPLQLLQRPTGGNETKSECRQSFTYEMWTTSSDRKRHFSVRISFRHQRRNSPAPYLKGISFWCEYSTCGCAMLLN